MIQAKHCDLCKFPKKDLKIGLTCGLTDKKPTFDKTCPDIQFSNEFKSYVPEFLGQIQHLKKRKASVYLNLFLFGIVGLTIIVGSYSQLTTRFITAFEPEFDYGNWKYFSVMFFLNLIGIQLIYMGFWPLNKNRKELKKLESDKRKINMILKNYNTDIETLLDYKKTTPQRV
ncbi:MAG TPA: hypothetical protein DCE27_06880 [Xanthomarina gelatinilytica]|uniref:hypothetical protein n=1 Tax=uncultured Xanthomarina sp. TaxID=1868331 RepID=UPI000EED1D7F|nr:hypothetical protein [Xanthomarina gelatinilytica]|tara:strand:- start:314 stop:829 length:516 start_codon:yes stop_codon:yes gene_type:complete